MIVLRQTVTMAIYMAIGFALFKTGKITREGSKNMAALLLWIVIPAVVLNSFCVEFTEQKLHQLVLSIFLSGAVLLISMLVSHIFFRNAPVDQFAAAYSNAGFMGIPLVRSTFGDEAVFFLVGFVALLNILQWTCGASLLQGKKVRLQVRQILLNPILLAAVAGIILFFTGLGTKVPVVMHSAIQGVAGLNAPLAMIVLGVYLAQTNIRTTITNLRLYWLGCVRLLIIPLLTVLFLMIVPCDLGVKLVILTAASAPVGSNVAVYAQLYDADYPYACQTVALTTAISVLTLPLMIAIGTALL